MMQQFPSYIVDAFTKTRFTGNPAAVCLINQTLQDEDYYKIAAEFNLSETAFPVPIGMTDFKKCSQFDLRWFTPTTEVPLCGHATLATSHVLFNEVGNINDEIKFSTKSGVLVVRKNGDALQMNFPKYEITSIKMDDIDNALRGTFSEFAAPEYLADVINCILPPEISIECVAYASNAKKLVVVIDPETTKFELESFKPDLAKVLQVHDGSFVRGIAITLCPKNPTTQGFIDTVNQEYDYVCRYFAPWVGIEEDPATGSAQCVLGPFWSKVMSKNHLYALQSYPKRGAQFQLNIEPDRVILNGNAVTVMNGQINLDEPKFY